MVDYSSIVLQEVVQFYSPTLGGTAFLMLFLCFYMTINGPKFGGVAIFQPIHGFHSDYLEEGSTPMARRRPRSIDMAALAHRVAVGQLDLASGEVIGQWPSARAASRHFNVSENFVGRVCRGLKDSAAGFGWQYTVERLGSA